VAHAPTQETIAQAYALAASAVEEARYGLLLTRYVLLVQFLKRMRTSTSSSALLEIQKIQSLPERLPVGCGPSLTRDTPRSALPSASIY
jgi:hypothetical protein